MQTDNIARETVGASEPSAIAAATIRRVSWRLIPFMCLLYFVAFLDRVNVSFAALTMNRDLGFSATVYGTGAGIFFLGYVLFEVPSNMILARVGARVWIARIMVTWGIVSLCTAFIHSSSTFYLLRFLLGVAEAGFFPGMILYLTYWFPAAYRARIVGAFMMAVPVSSALGAPISTALLALEAWDLRGWQWLFILEGIPAILLAAVTFLYLPDRPAQCRWLTAAQRDWLNGVLSEEQRGRVGHAHALRDALLSARVWLFGCVYFGFVVALFGLGFFLPQIIKSVGQRSDLEVGFLTMIPYLTAAVAMYLWARHSDATGERVWHVSLPAFVGAIGLAGSASFNSAPALALIAFTVSSIGIYSALPTFWILPTAMLSGAAAPGGIALINSIGNIGGYLGPVLVGYLKDQTRAYTDGLLLLALFMAASGILTLAQQVGRPKSNTAIAGAGRAG